jgi:hypothetical protein
MNTTPIYAKKAKKRVKKPISKRREKQTKQICRGPSPYFYSVFLKSWLLEPVEHYTSRILMALGPYNLPYKERYFRVLYFNKLTDIEKGLFTSKSETTRNYSSTQFDCLKAYRANQALRWTFKKLVLAWKTRKLQLMNDTDIITQEPIQKPVYIYDYKTNKKYQVEAKSLLVDSLNRFFLHSEFFPKSKLPRNLYTNEELSFSQLWSVSNQMRTYGITHWCWEAFVKERFSLNALLTEYEVPIKYEMVKRCFTDKTSSDANWFLTEFIQANTKGIVTKSLKWAVYHTESHSYISKWREICQMYWRFAVVRGELEAESNEWIQAHILELLKDEIAIQEIKRLYIETKKQ